MQKKTSRFFKAGLRHFNWVLRIVVGDQIVGLLRVGVSEEIDVVAGQAKVFEARPISIYFERDVRPAEIMNRDLLSWGRFF